MSVKKGYFTTKEGLPWQGRSISAGDETAPVESAGYTSKAIHFLSDTAGTLSILADAVGDGDFQTYDSVPISANELEVYLMNEGATLIKLKFDTAASVTAKYMFS